MTVPQIRSFEDYNFQYSKSIAKPEEFWDELAETFSWRKKWDKTLEWDFEKPEIKWFINGKMNITENCLDRHLEKLGDKTALIWEPNDPQYQAIKFTYNELYAEVCKLANVLKNNGIEKGDRVCIYLPMIPELTFALLACARIGAVHSVVFGGFSAHSLSTRVEDAKAKMVITADGLNRGTRKTTIKNIVDDALAENKSVEKVLVVNHLDMDISMKPGRDIWLDDELAKVSDYCDAEEMDSEDMLFILYTSGSTGTPKGVVHTCGGYMVYSEYTFSNVFQYKQGQIYWCTADIGWITGHTYIVYGPLLAGATTIMFEGTPTYPNAGRFWEVIDKHKVNIFYTAPTAIRSLMAFGLEFVKNHSLDSLKVLGTVGEPINEEAWEWFYKNIGKSHCPVVDTWWQTENGGIMISGLAGITPMKASFASYPLPGVLPVLLDQEGNEITENGLEGYLAIKFPWPGIMRTTYNNHERFKQAYFSHYKGYYFTGDGARRDMNGMYRIIGRVDDVINVSGHRFGTAEIENAINQCKSVIESAVVGYPHPIKGQGIYAYVVCSGTSISDKELIEKINKSVEKEIGKIARPDKIQIVLALPKTRSGKIMRRILRKIAEGEISNLGDTSTLLDPSVVDEIVQGTIE